MKRHRNIGTLLAVIALSSAVPSHAQQAGDTIVSVGVASLNPNAGLSPVNSSSPVFTGLLAGTRADISSTTTATLGVLHMFTDHLGAELTLGVPPTLDVDLVVPNGTPPQNHPNAAKARAWTPALVGKWVFNSPGSAWRPYLGLGVSYAYFDRIRINQSDPLVVTLGGGSADLDSSWAPVYNAGVIYRINDRWSVNASVSYIDLKTDVTLRGSGAGAGVTTRTTLDIKPTDIVVRVGYRF